MRGVLRAECASTSIRIPRILLNSASVANADGTVTMSLRKENYCQRPTAIWKKTADGQDVTVMQIAIQTTDKAILRTMKMIIIVAVAIVTVIGTMLLKAMTMVIIDVAESIVIQAEMVIMIMDQKKASSTTSSMALE
jgi:hypothetical protein